MKKILLSFIAVLLPLMASADPVEIGGIYYNLAKKSKRAEVTSKPNKYTGEVNIPSTVEYEGTVYNVTSIGYEAFNRCYNLTSVSIPNSVTSIGDNAFYGCNDLTSVRISDLEAWCNISFTNYLSNPLSNAHHLFLNGVEIEDLVIPNSVTSIGDYAFQGCSYLTSVTIHSSVTSIGGGAFYGCSGLTSVKITDLLAWCNIRFPLASQLLVNMLSPAVVGLHRFI